MQIDDILRIFSCVSLVIGAVECFAGFKMMKALLSIWSFFVGALLGVVAGACVESVALGLICVLIFGTGLVVLSYRFIVAGVFCLIAFLMSIALYIVFDNIFIAILLGIGVGVIAIYFVKPVVIVSTAFSGAGVILASAYMMMALDISDSPVAAGILWVPIAIAGIGVQYITTVKKVKENKKQIAQKNGENHIKSDKKIPSGMQRAYRNFCIECGCKLSEINERCPLCGSEIER